MSTTEASSEDITSNAHVNTVDMKLEVVMIPVSDVDRAKAFYARLGWRLDADFSKGGGRVVQFTPPGSQCSVHFGMNQTPAAPGSAQNSFLIVSDIVTARADLLARGVEVSDVFHYAGFDRIDPDGRLSGLAPERGSYGSFVSFSDPDGNGWIVQEITTRLPGRVDSAATSFGSASDLAAALRRAAAAHGEHEKRIGTSDLNWPDWYAAYLVAERAGGDLPR
jgi:catechol 2,3-dioxygenase-like lactoylglutathione lyase family enzyme